MKIRSYAYTWTKEKEKRWPQGNENNLARQNKNDRKAKKWRVKII